MYATLRAPVEYVRTVNYNNKTAATKRAMVEAEAKYNRDMAELGKMNLRQPGKWQKVSRVVAHEKVRGGSPLKRELKREDLENVVVESVMEESEDDGPTPSLMGEIAPEAAEEGAPEKAVDGRVEARADSPVSSLVVGETDKPEAPHDRDGNVKMLDVESSALCRCRPGYLCEYC